MRSTCRTCGGTRLRIEEKCPDTSRGLTLGGIHRCLGCGMYWEVPIEEKPKAGHSRPVMKRRASRTGEASYRGVTSIDLGILDL